MERSIAIFVALLILSAIFTFMSLGLAYRVTPEYQRRRRLRMLLAWFIKGLFIPAAVWALMNLGLAWYLQPFIPEIQVAQQAGDPWFHLYLKFVGRGLFVISSCWAVATILWALLPAQATLEKEARKDFRALCLTCFLAMLIPGIGIVYLGGPFLIGLALLGVVVPVAGYAPNIIQIKRVPPMYGRAIAKMKFGKYNEAEVEIIRELEQWEDDFDGWMMLADLYANNFNDLAGAEQTILDICHQPRTTPSQMSIALHRLADWYLKLASDPDAARRALQIICDRARGTHLARMAQLRINQLPQSVQELKEQQTAAPVHMPALGDQLDEPLPESTISRVRAKEMASECVEKLKLDPNNVPAREKLARIFTENLLQPEDGIEQLALLLEMPDQTEHKRAEWLGTIAAWHIRYRNDPESGRIALERLVTEFPKTPQALVAQRRIRLMGYA
jgi:hypothetical protein